MATKPRQSHRHAPPSRPPWLLFVGGIATGVFATLLVSTFLLPGAPVGNSSIANRATANGVTTDSARSTNAKPAEAAPGATPAANARTAVNPHSGAIDYQFDGVLKSTEVPVRDKDATIATARPDPTKSPSARMLLQAGSFRAAGDADSLRAELLLLAIGPVTTRDTLLPSGEVWHRVLIGPFADVNAMNAVQARLSRQNIETFPIAAAATAARPATTTVPAPAAVL